MAYFQLLNFNGILTMDYFSPYYNDYLNFNYYFIITINLIVTDGGIMTSLNSPIGLRNIFVRSSFGTIWKLKTIQRK